MFSRAAKPGRAAWVVSLNVGRSELEVEGSQGTRLRMRPRKTSNVQRPTFNVQQRVGVRMGDAGSCRSTALLNVGRSELEVEGSQGARLRMRSRKTPNVQRPTFNQRSAARRGPDERRGSCRSTVLLSVGRSELEVEGSQRPRERPASN